MATTGADVDVIGFGKVAAVGTDTVDSMPVKSIPPQSKPSSSSSEMTMQLFTDLLQDSFIKSKILLESVFGLATA